MRCLAIFLFGLLLVSGWAATSSSSSSSTGGQSCGSTFCYPGSKCVRCTDGSSGCFDINMYGSCCSCRTTSYCWACPRASQCNLNLPNFCNSTCSSNARCNAQAPYCQICLDGNEACFRNTSGVCCGCVNGRCWSCPFANQCSPNNPNYCYRLASEGAVIQSEQDPVIESQAYPASYI